VKERQEKLSAEVKKALAQDELIGLLHVTEDVTWTDESAVSEDAEEPLSC
jgi:hypothetical protein